MERRGWGPSWVVCHSPAPPQPQPAGGSGLRLLQPLPSLPLWAPPPVASRVEAHARWTNAVSRHPDSQGCVLCTLPLCMAQAQNCSSLCFPRRTRLRSRTLSIALGSLGVSCPNAHVQTYGALAFRGHLARGGTRDPIAGVVEEGEMLERALRQRGVSSFWEVS